jgi:hypothetical protein
MHNHCPWCKDYDGSKARVAKLKEPKVYIQAVAEVDYEITYTHQCEQCGCTFGDGKKKEVEVIE